MKMAGFQVQGGAPGANGSADLHRRRFLVTTTTVVGGIGTGLAAVPFLFSLQPSERALAAGAPAAVDVSKLEPGQQKTVQWRRKPVWVLRRTPEILANLKTLTDQLRDPESRVESQQPAYARNEYRSIRPELLVVVALCTHLGCVPSIRPDVAPPDLGPAWRGGYFCPCHGSRFDFAGRVFKRVPAPINLLIPPHRYISDQLIRIGEDATQA
jgi:ubiquinol-cytochrome c reductase iron-sulfur subunit